MLPIRCQMLCSSMWSASRWSSYHPHHTSTLPACHVIAHLWPGRNTEVNVAPRSVFLNHHLKKPPLHQPAPKSMNWAGKSINFIGAFYQWFCPALLRCNIFYSWIYIIFLMETFLTRGSFVGVRYWHPVCHRWFNRFGEDSVWVFTADATAPCKWTPGTASTYKRQVQRPVTNLQSLTYNHT